MREKSAISSSRATNDCATVDFETRSACSLKTAGSWRYSLDPSTEVLCLAFHLPNWPDDRVELWHPSFPALGIAEAGDESLYVDLFMHVLGGGLVEAHNAWFERGIWTNICLDLGWPVIKSHQWRCSAAKAAAHSLPRSLDDAAAALGLSIRKDAAGSKVMMKMNKPRKPRKKEREAGVQGLLWWETPDLFATLWEYCKQDVRAEVALSAALPNLSTSEQELYELDQTINERGFALDRPAIGQALILIEVETTRLNLELASLTQGQVTKATQRAKLTSWLKGEGVFLPDTTAETVEAYLSPESREPIVGPARRALEILQSLGKASTAKYQAMQNWICPDNRVHGGLLFHGASTGRWTGAGVQPHNFPKGIWKDEECPMTDVWSYLQRR